MNAESASNPLRVLFGNRMACLERGGGETFDLEISHHLAYTFFSASFGTVLARIPNPVSQPLVSVPSPFWNSVVICVMSGFVAVNSGQWMNELKGAKLSRTASLLPLLSQRFAPPQGSQFRDLSISMDQNSVW